MRGQSSPRLRVLDPQGTSQRDENNRKAPGRGRLDVASRSINKQQPPLRRRVLLRLYAQLYIEYIIYIIYIIYYIYIFLLHDQPPPPQAATVWAGPALLMPFDIRCVASEGLILRGLGTRLTDIVSIWYLSTPFSGVLASPVPYPQPHVARSSR